jgi:hypothetical protein
VITSAQHIPGKRVGRRPRSTLLNPPPKNFFFIFLHDTHNIFCFLLDSGASLSIWPHASTEQPTGPRLVGPMAKPSGQPAEYILPRLTQGNRARNRLPMVGCQGVLHAPQPFQCQQQPSQHVSTGHRID